MSTLNNRQRLVLMNALKGMNQTEAYEAVYGPNPNSYTLASELFRKPHFKAELDRLLNQQLVEVQASVLSRDEKRQILAEIARAQTADFMDETGEPKLTRETPNSRAAREFYHRRRYDRYGNEIVTKSIKLLNPIEAIQEDNKMAGDYAPSKHVVASYNVNVSFKPKARHGDDD